MARNYAHAVGTHSLFLLGSTIVGLLLCCPPAPAHEIHISAHAHGTSIEGEAYSHDKSPVPNAKVTAFDPAGEKIGETTTDEKGEFRLEPRFRCDHRLLLDTGDGHGAECTVPAAQLPASLPPRGEVPEAHSHAEEPDHEHAEPDHDQLEAIRSQIVELHEQLDGYEQKTRLRDVLGGIGYIVGIAGVAFYFLGVRRRHSTSTT